MGARAALLVALAALAPLAAPASLPAAAAPAIRFERTTCELGTVTQGEKPACAFPFVNAGAADLAILQVEPSCGCTSALPTAPLVRAGGRGEIAVTFDSSSFAGEVVKEVAVRTSDPALPEVTLRIRALVEPEVDFEPRAVTFDAVRPGALQRQTVMLTNRRADPVAVRAISAEPGTFSCRLPAWADRARPFTVESWDRVVIEVEMNPPAAVSMPIAGQCTLTVAGPRIERFTLKLLALPAKD